MGISRLNIREKKKVTQNQNQVLIDEKVDVSILVARVIDGDVEAFGEIYSRYITRIYRYIYYQVADKMTAEDLTEEIFLKAWKSIRSYTGKGQAFSSWLYRIAHNHVIDYFRKMKRQKSLETEFIDTTPNPEQEVEQRLMRQEVLNLISHLPANQKQIIVLKFIEGLDNHEIQQITGKTLSAIRITQMRALSTLRNKLKTEC